MRVRLPLCAQVFKSFLISWLHKNHNIYSGRHTTTLDLYNSFKNQGLTDLESKHKLMTITRHKSISGLENYLRDIGASLPKDYSNDYTLNF